MKNFSFLILFLFLSFGLFAQNKPVGQPSPAIKWLTLGEAQKLCKDNPKTILVDVYTDWCVWCKKMLAGTFSDPFIVNYINANFYPVRFNAESHDSIRYQDTLYKSTQIGARAPHQLAIKLLNGRLSYPTIVYIDKEGRRSPVAGYYDSQHIMPILVYFAEDINRSTAYPDFEKNFRATFPLDSSGYKKPKNLVKWYSLEEAIKMNQLHPRKIMVNWYANWSISSMLMYASTFNDPAIADYINKNYYPVRIDATTKDTLNVFGQKFVNENKQHPFHQLAVAMLEGKMTFPATLFLDENNKLIDRMQVYLTPENLRPILNYYGGNIYRTTKWADYLKTYRSQVSKTEAPKEDLN